MCEHLKFRTRYDGTQGRHDVERDERAGLRREQECRHPRARLHLTRFHGVLAPNAGLRAVVVPGPAQVTSVPSDEHAHGAPARMGWARLLKRVFDLDLPHCPQCGGALRIIAAIEALAVIVKILTHLGLPARAPPRAPARRPELFRAA